jgi:hypothetical protein
VRAPRSMQKSAEPKHTAAARAKRTGRGDTAPLNSGPDASRIPTTATAMPTHAHRPGESPVATPRTIGTMTPIEAIGATTPMAPSASAV